ncbi:MAG: DUF4232 domain-containing protein [Solirubrobacteraceae bacterium]
MVRVIARTLAASTLAALTLAACGSSGTSSTSGSPTPAPARHSIGVCTAPQLKLTYVGTDGATGHLEVTLALHNVSASRCTLHGYPGARLLGTNGSALPLRVKRGGGFFPDTQRSAHTVTLKPGGRARFGVSFVTNNEFAGAHTCRTAATAMSSPPGATTHWWRLSLRGAPRISPCGDQLVVSPVYA